jgi:tetratricopeptide (TPR) repeat protein
MNEEHVAQEEISAPAAMAPKRLSGSWRIVIAIVAVGVIAFLAYPLIKQPARSTVEPQTTPAAPPTAPQLTAPQATAQADPTLAQAQFELGNSYVKTMQWDQALAAYQKAVELDPNYQAAYANLGVVYYQLGQLDLAASQYQKALELDPTDGEVAYNLGAVYLQQALSSNNPPNPELLNKSIEQLSQAAELNPDLAEPYFSLGVAYQALNQNKEAIQAFETFLAKDTGQDPRAGQEAQRYLEALRSQ